MPQVNDTVHIRFSLRGLSGDGGGPFWQTNATIASVAQGVVLLDGLDRQVPASVTELKRAGANRWTLDWEVRTRP
ncbi:hypothetical protein [Brevundimonas sp. SORGH_AS_0993]|uniref:hypothetical protein n=1 Tax=Brevundimonas sp. SORGH_AS_0993 TaxID=3041794 RepID=UPI002782DDF7|nr:hypothetical protein [Brevundimonas sp. SORGH_AS_0993]MDQ1153148.1 hypothetical protein [Brevundimonas sp. SORGH_AS_0993]